MGKGKWHVFEGDDTLVVFKGRGGDWMYFNAQDDRDKGSVIDWMKNRVSSDRIAGLGPLPGRNLWQSVNDHFRAYLNLPEEQRPRLDLPPIVETAPGEKFHSIYTQHCRPLENTAYLEGRGITKSTIANPQFAGRILNQLYTVQKEGMLAKTYVNTAFPAYHEGRVVGLELKGEGFKGQAPESQFTRSLWLSKPPEGQPAAVLVVSESALDTLSYAQLHPGESALYASTAGTLTQNKIFELKRLLSEEGIPAIRAAFDNDTQGHHFDTRLLAGVASEQNPMKVVREHEQLLTVEITAAHPAGVQALGQHLKSYNDQATRQYAQENGEPGNPASSQTLRDELIHSNKLGAHTYQFHVPMSREALAAFNQAASQALVFEHRVEIVKSQGKDWNQDLKQDQLQRVVQRELGGIDEDQYGFGQQHWDNPPIEGQGKIAQLHEAQVQARCQGERLLIVELRESRDAVALLPALREKLEKVGLTIDHAVKLESTAPREIATELTLRYRLDSPQLPAISDALDALRLNPRATVIEPGPDATERRQLAAAQEQQRQTGPQLVPSDSPAHDQARQSFIEAAGLVARELRASTALLDAARLQEVSRQLLTRPALQGLNRENVEKVLAVVDKLNTLKDNPAVQQLRQAVQQLEQLAQAQPVPQKNRPGPRL
ncbi:toprim domain-containing protein [Hymenobacter sp. M29]|uniref:Toprim domain-containing protein n=1 Tax=Hymenobacter mellowenesis TaxID=3063995 RepID=A0ABT9AFJ1_9BACT|nr:toprim domain-containing protein [Hymenobacter sp. M29]MDO7848589.1 toprim domain-containing protein [Hymenobacter sp. M29]